jgi:hypothetical protein
MQQSYCITHLIIIKALGDLCCPIYLVNLVIPALFTNFTDLINVQVYATH